MKRKWKIVSLLVLVSICGLTVVTIGDASGWWTPMQVTVDVDAFTKMNSDTEIDVECSKTADSIVLYIDGVPKQTHYNKRTTTFEYDFTTIGKHQVSAVAYSGSEWGVDTEYTRVKYKISDPSSSTENLATDGYRHPNHVTVYDAMIKVIQDANMYTLSEVSVNPFRWAKSVWARLRIPSVTDWGASDDWYRDTDMASDYINDGVFATNKYACADYAVFISGIARAAGIPSRIWSIVGPEEHGSQAEHMWAEVYIPTKTNINSGWLAMSIFMDYPPDQNTSSPYTQRVNWQTWVSDPDYFRFGICAFDYGTEWAAEHITLIYDLIYVSNPSTSQYKAWVTSDEEINECVAIGADCYYYGIRVNDIHDNA